MSRAYFYLTLHKEYAKFLGGLHWTVDAIEEADGSTFALSVEIAALLEGIASAGEPLHFEAILHLLHLLGRGKKECPPWARELRETFARTGKSLGNAGAFFGAVLDVPRVAAPLDVGAVLRRLRGVPSRGEDLATFDEEPALSPEEFEAAARRAVEDQTRSSLEHWLGEGRPPVRAAAIAEEVARLPRSLDGAFAAALRRPRLEGSVPFVAPLVSALALPRRALANPELPLGGYVDVTTRGGFDQILASQLVLDELEFVRRFAANELLYYRREEPHAERNEELVLLVDQGVRTWGFVRMVLAAACVAFGKTATKRKIPFLVATTADGGRLVDPVAEADDTVASLLEASDFSANPGLALEKLLEAPSEPGRDVVLLTHARSVAQADVLAAARRLRAGARLFCVGVDDEGGVGLHELRHGAPIVRSRCRVDPTLAQPPRAPERIVVYGQPSTPWRGDVEPIGFPFRFGLTGTLLRQLAFDRLGAWVLASGRHGMLHAARTDGSRFEVLPRGLFTAAGVPGPLTDVAAVFGETDGFAVVGTIRHAQVVVHYDLQRRRARAVAIAYLGAGAAHDWHHVPQLRSVVLRQLVAEAPRGVKTCMAIDLDTGAASARSNSACELVQTRGRGIDQKLAVISPGDLALRGDVPSIELDPAGSVLLRAVLPAWSAFTPLADGRPELAGQRVSEARLAGQVLAATFHKPNTPNDATLRVYQGPTGAPLGALPAKASGSRFALSGTGAQLVREIGPSRVEVRDTAPAGNVFSFPSGRFHHDVQVELGPVWLRIHSSRYRHLVSWHGDRLDVAIEALPAPGEEETKRIAPRPYDLPKLAKYDSARFGQCVTMGLTAVVDVFGHVVILDRTGERLLAVFFTYRRQLAAWMPDGTRFGSPALLDGPPTAGAGEHLASVLMSESLSK